jgi:hypothetical protein
MAVVSIFKVTGPGDPDEVFKIQDEKVAPAAREYAQANGGISHITAKTDDGLLVINLWESAEAAAAAGQEIMPVAQDAGLQQSDYQQYEVLRHEAA